MELVWTHPARADLRAIVDWIAADNPDAALDLVTEIERRVDALPAQPGLGRPGRVDGTRELVVHPNYVVIYDTQPASLRILRVLHAARRWP